MCVCTVFGVLCASDLQSYFRPLFTVFLSTLFTVCSCRVIHYSVGVGGASAATDIAISLNYTLRAVSVFYGGKSNAYPYITRNFILTNIGSSFNFAKRRSPIPSTPDLSSNKLT